MPQKLNDASDIEITEADIPAMVEEVHTKFRINPRDVSPEDTAKLFAAVIRGGS